MTIERLTASQWYAVARGPHLRTRGFAFRWGGTKQHIRRGALSQQITVLVLHVYVVALFFLFTLPRRIAQLGVKLFGLLFSLKRSYLIL